MRRKKDSYQPTIQEERAKVLHENSSFHVKEAYKAARTNTMFSLPGEGCKKIVLTSSFPGEGKSTTCLNLAITFAQTGSKVLVIDCDLRKPTIHRKLDVSNANGITHVVSGMCGLEEGVIQASTYENLDVITSGHIPPNPAELLGSEKMKQILEELETRYDYIFIDTPPLNLVTDATLLSPVTSGTIVIVRQEVTHHRDLQDSLEKLNFVGAKLLGVMIHDVKEKKVRKRTKYGKYSTYSYYGYKGYAEDSAN